jgi:hypothetical protein
VEEAVGQVSTYSEKAASEQPQPIRYGKRKFALATYARNLQYLSNLGDNQNQNGSIKKTNALDSNFSEGRRLSSSEKIAC